MPEDTSIPLSVMELIFQACSPSDVSPGANGGGARATVPAPSRLHIRRFLKTLIDRSLVLGTVDRPQLHDIVWEFVKSEVCDEYVLRIFY